MKKKQESLKKKGPGTTPRGEKQSCANCFKHPCFFHIESGEDKEIFCDNYDYLDFYINFGGENVPKQF